MLFKIFRSSSSSAPTKPTTPKTQDRHLTSTQSCPADSDSKSPEQVATRETSKDYEAFLENAKREAELKDREMLRMAKEAERRRREFNMDPWASRW
jgi:hypothetical protein